MSKKPSIDRGPWADYSDRFATDDLLRRHGYRIKARPAKGPVIWERRGRVFSQGNALSLLAPDEVKDALMLEELHRSGELDGCLAEMPR